MTTTTSGWSDNWMPSWPTFLMALILALALGASGCARAAPNPPYTANELAYLPVLKAEIDAHWPDVPWRAPLGAQVNQETCASLTHRKCWSPTAELKTSREYGFGLGQLTVTSQFDNFAAAKQLHPTLSGWDWDNRYDPEFQLRTMVLMNRFNYGKVSWAATQHERMAFTFAAYNGGLGGVLSDRGVCRATAGCDPSKWFGHVQLTSKKAKTAASGYGKSFFEINREYVSNVMIHRRARYRPYFGE